MKRSTQVALRVSSLCLGLSLVAVPTVGFANEPAAEAVINDVVTVEQVAAAAKASVVEQVPVVAKAPVVQQAPVVAKAPVVEKAAPVSEEKAPLAKSINMSSKGKPKDPVDPDPPTDPGPVDPGPVDPGPVDPGPVDPGPVDPGPVDPGPVDPGPVDPGPVDPGPVDPGPVDPGPVDPGPTNPPGKPGTKPGKPGDKPSKPGKPGTKPTPQPPGGKPVPTPPVYAPDNPTGDKHVINLAAATGTGQTDTEEGGELPKTATSYPNQLFSGLGVMLLGALLFVFGRKKKVS
ncbi:LPXTG cell wall anchor domain-containing protein [Hazenella coriacea]|uniref:LPXTG-motif cell wall-anchored protein n=1 Tax=Hazenella coriacea TaxID=1179467 RepID=A0A4R3LA46_9BACL|nr:LPXTG cell wall anchor domain-containing protein [Hazenella coriacea]TCS96703.1 LPXTG-motif cell wall-anchored protein [Hazenella coriacea]